MKYFILFFFIVFSGCYQEYMQITIENGRAAFSSDNTKVAFFKFVRISKPAKGLAAFPDGGIPRVYYQDASVYYYDTDSQILMRLFSYGNLITQKARWHNSVSLNNHKIAFGIRPLSGWDKEISYDSQKAAVYNKFSGIFIYDLIQNQSTRIVNSGYHPVFSPNGESLVFLDENEGIMLIKNISYPADITNMASIEGINPYSLNWINDDSIVLAKGKNEFLIINVATGSRQVLTGNPINPTKPGKLNALTKNVKITEWITDFEKFCPKTKKEKIAQVVELKGNVTYRLALVEMLLLEINTDEIKEIIRSIHQFEKGLHSLEKIKYHNAQEKILEFLNSRINKD